MKSKLARFRRSVFCLYLTVNMLLVSIIFFPVVRERETFSSLLGRSFLKGKPFPRWLVRPMYNFVNWIFRDPKHCIVTYLDEQLVRDRWYGND